jgi:hypothetical protein
MVVVIEKDHYPVVGTLQSVGEGGARLRYRQIIAGVSGKLRAKSWSSQEPLDRWLACRLDGVELWELSASSRELERLSAGQGEKVW